MSDLHGNNTNLLPGASASKRLWIRLDLQLGLYIQIHMQFTHMFLLRLSTTTAHTLVGGEMP